MFDEILIPDDPFSAPKSGGKLDTMLVQTMLHTVQTGIQLIQLKRDMGLDVKDDEINDLVYLQQGAINRIRTDQSRRQKKARDMKDRKSAMEELNRKPVIEEDDEDIVDLPF